MDEDRIAKVIDMSAARSERSLSWQGRLGKNTDGAPLPTIANAMILFANDPALVGLLAYDAFRSEHLITRPAPAIEDGASALPGPYPRSWGAEDVAIVQSYFQRLWSPKFARATVEDAMLASAALARFHPVVDWLDGLVWDGTPRVDTWLVQAFGARDTPYHRAVGAKFMIAAVRRLREPGCKFDHMPVLEGNQGIGKSRTIKALFGASYFSDAIPSDLTSKDAAMALLGVWCLEFAEIEHLIRAEVETIKAFLSRSVDRYRPPYGRSYVERPRQGVLIGTTNSDDYLRDATGNRRIWPVRCKTADDAWVERNREQLWAEAAIREATDEPIWLDDGAVQEAANTAQSYRMTEDVWSDAIASWLTGRPEVKVADILTDCLYVPRERQGKAHEMRVGSILKQMGWRRVVVWRGSAIRIWKPAERW